MAKYQALVLTHDSMWRGARRAYGVHKIRNTDQLTLAAAEEVVATVSSDTLAEAKHEAWLEHIRRSLAGKFGQIDAHGHAEQLDWLHDRDVQRPLRDRGEMIAIGDMTLEHVEIITKQMEANINAAREEFERFETAKSKVVPIMSAHGLTWGQACEYLESIGEL